MMICEARHKGRVRGPSCVLTLVFFETPRRSETHSCALERLNQLRTRSHELNEQQDVINPPNQTHTHYITTIMFGARGRSPRRGEGKTRVVKKPKSTRLNASALCEG